MKNVGKITLGLLLTASVSAGVSYLTVQRAQTFGFGYPNTFGQNAHTVSSQALSGVETDFTVAAEKSIDAVVHIAAKSSRTINQPTDIFEYFFGFNGQQAPRQQQQQQIGYGSGVIISTDGYIVTNNHVVNGADEITVTLNERTTYPAKVIGTDENTDVALIKIEANNLPFIPFGNSDNLKVGEWVLAVGNPMNLASTVTAGIVSAKARNLGIIDSEKNENQYQNNPFFQQQQQSSKPSKSLSIESFIQTDAAVNPGNSGGALVNLKGELVGINTAIISPTGTFAGYSFAIPVSIVAKVVNDIRKFGQVQRAMLGVTISDINTETAKVRKIDVQEGVYVDGVADLSGALEAGIKKGDIIKAIDGIKVKTINELQAQVGLHHPSDVVEITLLRDKEEKKFKVTLRNMKGGTETVKTGGIELLGAAFSEVSPEVKRSLNIGSGVQVSGIKDGKFKLAGIRKGFIILKVNDQRIESVDQLEKIVNEAKNNSGFDNAGLFIVGIYPNGKVSYYAFDMTEQ
ncbi:MAG TPA: trypsin-like peptidase domain-containing protein [Bacteroidales bacterium]|nr:trypsin-like peptidase domain-containing protein [Bacteroidales bacterium]